MSASMLLRDLANWPICRGFVFLLAYFVSPYSLSAQPPPADSLIQALEQTDLHDSTRIRLTLAVADQLYASKAKQVIELLGKLRPHIHQATQGQLLDYWHYYGAAYQGLGQTDSVEYYHQMILSRITKEEDDRRYARALANLGAVYRMRGELDKAARRLEETLTIFEAKADPFPKGTVRNSLGLIYDAQGDYRSAMKVYLEALAIFESVDHPGAQAVVLNNIGRVYQAQRDQARAIRYYQRYRQISEQLGQTSGVANALNNIGTVYSETGELDSAEYYLKESVRMKEEVDITNNLASSLNNLGKVANLKGKYREAIDYNQRALALARQYQDKKDEAFCLLELGKSYEGEMNPAAARPYYQQARTLAKSMGDVALRYASNEGLYRVYRTSHPERAISYLEQAFVLKDSILNAENTEALTTLRLENAFAKKELIHQQKITTMKFQEAIQSAQMTSQRTVIIALVAILLVLGGMVYQLLRQKKKIQRQHQTISRALKEKDTLLREIHHRVKNNLQVISSLLGIQSRQVTDRVAVEALNEGRSRVHTMSLIHQNLYQQDNQTAIPVRTYFEKLVGSLFNTYNISPEHITITTDIDDLLLDVDTVVPLGLVINELVSNALKYAFPSGNGHVEIVLKEQLEGLFLSVTDNGIGISNPEVIAQKGSYGYELIQALVDKLEGTLEVDNQQGTRVAAVFKEYQKAA